MLHIFVAKMCFYFREPPANYLRVHYHKTGIKGGIIFCAYKVYFYYVIICSDSPEVPNTIGVCVKPLHFTYNKTLELLQFIELNRILGVSR